jgi:hypothetical protein
LHTFRPKSKPGSGWIAKEMFQEAYEEDCVVTNLKELGSSDGEDEKDLVCSTNFNVTDFMLNFKSLRQYLL